MVPTPARPLARVVTLALAGIGVAFAWMCLVLLLGAGSTGAHAEERPEGGLLDSVASAADQALGHVTDTASAAVATVTEVVAPVTTAVAEIAPPVAPVVEASASLVETAVSETVAPVAAAADAGVVTQATAPVSEVVANVPVAGPVLSASGADTALHQVTTAIDGALSTLATTLLRAAEAIPAGTAGENPGAVIPALPALSGLVAASSASGAPTALGLDTSAPLTALRTAAYAAVTGGAADLSATALSTSAPAAPGGGAPLTSPPAGLALPGGGSLTGSGGAGPGSVALLAVGPLVAYRAWVRRHGPTNDAVPAGPAGSTDVSPD